MKMSFKNEAKEIYLQRETKRIFPLPLDSH